MSKKYNPEQNYYFVDYTLIEDGHPDFLERMKKDDPSYSRTGSPRWVRIGFQTEQDVQDTLNFVFNPYPHQVMDLCIRSEEQLNKIVSVDPESGKTLSKSDKGYEEGTKMTEREYLFGDMYQSVYETKIIH